MKSIFLNQKISQQVDEWLMGPNGGYSIYQLMELAGLSVAQSFTRMYPLALYPRVLVVAGPGNNGGDGLVAARHLFFFGYKPTVVYPKRPQKEIFIGLVKQLGNLGVPITDSIEPGLSSSDVVLDGIFGFSFEGSIRAPFDSIIKLLKETKLPICSIDIPSGWDVEKGNISNVGLEPDSLISLTAPKLCAQGFKGRHFVGGRFVPPSVTELFNFTLPTYERDEQVVEITQKLCL